MQMTETKDLETLPSFSTLAPILQLIDKLVLSHPTHQRKACQEPGLINFSLCSLIKREGCSGVKDERKTTQFKL